MGVFYKVRVVNKDGELVTKRRFTAQDAAFRFAQDKLIHRREVQVRRQVVDELKIYSNDSWGITAKGPNGPWQKASGPFKMSFFHTSVTKQLPVSASLEEERAQMRLLDQIARSRGFNGISYSWVIFPSGRIHEGRGNFVVEAATEGFNTTSDSICFAGNGDQFALSSLQIRAATGFLNKLQNDGVYVKSGLDVRGHREVSTEGKSCPGNKVPDSVLAGIQAAVN